MLHHSISISYGSSPWHWLEWSGGALFGYILSPLRHSPAIFWPGVSSQLPLVRSFHAYFCVSSYLAINLCLYKSVPIDIGFIWKGQNIVLFSSILRGGFIALLREEWARIRSRAIIFGFSPRLDMVQTCPHENNLLWNFPPASNLAENRPQTQRRQITNHAK